VTCVSCDACPFLSYISDRIRSVQRRSQFSVGDSNGKFVGEEERTGTRSTEELEVGL
jgi:hypothetical protein